MLSIIITAHSEGLLAHKTMLSVKRACRNLEKQGITYEILISIDAGNDETINYFGRYKGKTTYTILNVDFKDLSSSRNYAVSAAQGVYITFIDADDLMSANWLVAGYTLATQSAVIVHPEYSVTFGDDNLIWKKENSKDITDDTLKLIDNNLWDSPCLARREIFIEHPYVDNGNGFGYEDKQFNSETIAAGVAHVVAPRTILFVRRKITNSVLGQANSNRVTIAPTKLLAYEQVVALNIHGHDSDSTGHDFPTYHSVLALSKRQSIRSIKKLHAISKNNAYYSKAIQPLQQKRKDQITARLHENFPDWMDQEWREIHLIDNTIFPSRATLQSIPWYNAQNTAPGLAYTKLVQSFAGKPDTLFFVPWLIKGGADMLFVNYSNELARIRPEWNIHVVQTEKKDSVWLQKLSDQVGFVDIENIFQGLDFDTQYRLLATLLTQNGIKRIIIGNSQLAYDFLSMYPTLVKRLRIAVYCFAFGEEFDEEGRLWGHIHTGIPRVYPSIHRVITDNKNTVMKLEREYGFDPAMFRTHYQPTEVPIMKPQARDRTPLKILWASRVCKQKRPDILKKVSNSLPVEDFTIEAYGQLEEGLTPAYFNDSRVHYCGSFDGISSIPTEDYDIFLYTSEGDGVPNVLQEITASGLPIVASNVGGIREFIQNGKTGCLVENHNDIHEYVSAIEELRSSRLRSTLVAGAQALLAKEFSKDSWKRSIQDDFDL